MTAQISAYGRLVAEPQSRTTANGAQMAMARLAVSLPCHSSQDGQATFWLGIVAFGKQAEALVKHQKGDMISVMGNMQINQWTGQDGGTQSGYQVVADAVVSVRTSRPAGRQGQQGQADNALQRAKQQATDHQQQKGQYPAPEDEDQRPPFDDDLPF
ncbi:single-stranded DNA-binding protein [Edwardsiella tarda]|uniref:single-stranded DNA-binding protein n=1 Tax=Edwardsiella TaxID=635 RepID=UPI00084BE02E|nr:MULTISPECIES: single-stranded DNA-binding protein [Edwardsiella]AOP43931.1 single-stranded DNA-binding protein [Edwardsiella piscicida]UCQ30533.1 single-stranded DNA-binding protein [Edwardsiella piscicida]UCQ56858.1 single-stranded DNA-binding protein [Edwardsiella piscicida]WKS81900.1 single-stranded DNA-binding protein [Edwardsiella tarda]